MRKAKRLSGSPDFLSLLSDADTLQLMLVACPDGVVVFDPSDRVVLYTGAAEGLFGFAPIEVMHKPVGRLFEGDGFANLRARLHEDGHAANVEMSARRKNARPFAAAVSVAVLRDRYGNEMGAVLYIRDHSGVRSIESALRDNNQQLNDMVGKLDRMARHDQLTGLLYRGSAIEAAERAILSSGLGGMGFGVAIFDLDRFKAVNDSYGHLVGDEVLRSFAAVLRASMRQGDVLGRFGGEEFIAFLPGASLADTAGFAERVRRALHERRIDVGEELHLRVTVSAGVAAIPSCADSLREAIQVADDRLFGAKRSGRNQVRASNDFEGRHAA